MNHVELADSKRARQVQLAADVTAILEETPRFTELRRNLFEAIWYGGCAPALHCCKTQSWHPGLSPAEPGTQPKSVPPG